MPITRLELTDFRNYHRFAIEPGEKFTILVGPNAAGKTNAIEAIELVTAGRSFRRPRWEDLVRRGVERARVGMEARTPIGVVEIHLDIGPGNHRAYRIDSNPARRISDVAGKIPSVIFTPEDLSLVKGASDNRRAALDDLGEQLSQAYATAKREYGRVVRQRNALLRDTATRPTEVAAWDESLVSAGSRLLMLRTGLLGRIAPRVTEAYRSVAGGETLALSYEDKVGIGPQGWAEGVPADVVAEAMRKRLRERAAEERARLVTLVGPHRDDIRFAIAGEDARTFASQGQQRTAALAWKLAEVGMIEEVLHREPVLLLDDVMSELDESRRRALTSLVKRDVQTFVTSTTTGYFDTDLLSSATIVELSR